MLFTHFGELILVLAIISCTRIVWLLLYHLMPADICNAHMMMRFPIRFLCYRQKFLSTSAKLSFFCVSNNLQEFVLAFSRFNSPTNKDRSKAIGRFRVPKTLTFKMRLGAQPFSWKRVLFAWDPYQRLSTFPSFWNRGPGELGNGLLQPLFTHAMLKPGYYLLSLLNFGAIVSSIIRN